MRIILVIFSIYLLMKRRDKVFPESKLMTWGLIFIIFSFFIAPDTIIAHEQKTPKEWDMTLENPFHWNDPVIIELIRLDYANAEELARVLAPLLSKDGRIVSYGPANSLIIKDRASIVKRIMEIVKGRSEQ